MIKLEHVVLPSPEQMEFIIEGMRNPMNSWDKSDSVNCGPNCNINCKYAENDYDEMEFVKNFYLGNNDRDLMKRLAAAGTDHRKFMRMMPVYVRITAPLYWWKEFDTYKVGTVANSCSTMHKIQDKEFTLDDFSIEHLLRDAPFVIDTNNNYGYVSPLGMYNLYIIPMLNECRKLYLEFKYKIYWWQMIQLLPSSYNQTRNVILNYEVLANIYKSRKDHKLDEWREFCKWIEELPYSELIVSEK